MGLFEFFYLTGIILNLICMIFIFKCTDRDDVGVMTYGRLIRILFFTAVPIFNLIFFAIETGTLLAHIDNGDWKFHGKVRNPSGSLEKFYNRINNFLNRPILK